MEEAVGKWWDAWIRAHARNGYPEASVSLDSIRGYLAVSFRAFGGEKQLRIAESAPVTVPCYRNWRQKIAGIGNRFALAYQDGEVLALPDRIDWLPQKQLNRFAYLWLCLMNTVPSQADDHVEDMRLRTVKILENWPGVRTRYQSLARAYCQVRSQQNLPEPIAAAERRLSELLQNPFHTYNLSANKLAYPVQIWPQNVNLAPNQDAPTHNGPSGQKTGTRSPDSNATRKRRKGRRVERPQDKNGLMLYRFETIFSRAEYASLSRSLDEDQDDDLNAIADDLDEIAVTQTDAGSGRLKMDLDLPAEQVRALRAKKGILLPEWDYRKNTCQRDQVRLIETIAEENNDIRLEHLRPVFAKVQKQLRAFLPDNIKLRNQADGEEIDLNAWQDFHYQSQTGRVCEPNLYVHQRRAFRDLATFVLADLSLSTDTWIDNERRVIDTLKDSLIVLDDALTKLGDPHAFAGFWSKRNELVNFIRIKDFGSKTPCVPRVMSLQPGYYTRMGAAIRHAAAKLTKRPEKRRLLLLLTDGKPNDLDLYEGRYGIEDTRHAILEARQKGVTVFCVTIDKTAEDYLPYIFGRSDYALIQRPQQLPEVLPRLYLKMTTP